jgi:hypothetical protein
MQRAILIIEGILPLAGAHNHALLLKAEEDGPDPVPPDARTLLLDVHKTKFADILSNGRKNQSRFLSAIQNYIQPVAVAPV